jgi:Dirigent-like protein
VRRYGIVLVLIVSLVAAWGTSASAIGSPQTFSLLEVSTPNSDQPMGDFTFNRPPRGGDQFAVANELYKWAGTKKGARAGRDEVVLTFVTGFGSDFSQKATVLFVAQVYLQGGAILIQGYGQVNPNGPSKYTFPIVGGTGTYANARGYVSVRDLGDGNQNTSNLEFHLMS